MQILFAHFYSRVPRHLMLNLRRTISLFPEHEVCLVTDQDFSNIDVSELNLIKYAPSANWTNVESILNHPTEFRNNFWFISLSRFIAIGEVLEGTSESILHIESDVLLAADFPFDNFLSLDKDFAFPVVSQDLAIASCLFFKNGSAAGDLAKFTIDSVHANHSTTDMHILRDFMKKYPERVQLLPSTPMQLDAIVSASDEFLTQTERAIPLFDGIFDGFDIGRFLFGDDPRNDRGFSILRRNDPRTYLDTSRLNLYVTDERDFPYVRNSLHPFVLPIYALHIHSKNLKLFKLKETRKMLKKAVLDSKNESQKIFSLTIFLKSALISIRRRYRLIRHSR
jgi:hypothetical protein